MLSVTTLKDHISADVKLDLPEMDTTVQVIDFFCLISPKGATNKFQTNAFLPYLYVYYDKKKCSPSQEITIFVPSRLPRVNYQ